MNSLFEDVMTACPLGDGSEAELSRVRARILEWVTVPGAATPDVLACQIRILVEVGWSEGRRRQWSKRSEEHKRHKKHEALLRILGDSIAWIFLDSHIIRNLAKNPGSPGRAPTILGQLEGLPHLMKTAIKFRNEGHVVVLCDITNHLLNGDLVVVNQCDESIRVVECKRSERGSRTARARRQTSRASAISSFLNTDVSTSDIIKSEWAESIAEEIDAASGNYDVSGLVAAVGQAPKDETVQATEVSGMTEDISPLQVAMENSREPGQSHSACGQHDATIVVNLTDEVDDFRPQLPDPDLSSTLGQTLLSRSLGDLIREPSSHYRPPVMLDLPYQDRLAILEGDVAVMHVCRASEFLGTRSNKEPGLSVVDVWSNNALVLSDGEVTVLASPRFVGLALYEWKLPSSIREELLISSERLVSEEFVGELKPSYKVLYETH